MTTTTGDPSSLKTPSTLSGGDLVSRLLAATPPYLYNVPLTPHSFFFSEMLRSFVQAKAETGTSATNSPSNVPRRRKRSWRDARDRPLELTTKDKNHHHQAHPHLHHHHHHHHHQPQQHQQQLQQQKEKYFQAQQQQTQQETHIENRFNKSSNDSTNYTSESKRGSNYEEKSTSFVNSEPVKSVDDNLSDFSKQNRDFYDDSSRRFSNEQTAQQEALFVATTRKIKPEESSQQPQTGTGEVIKNCNYTTERNTFEERAKITNQELSFLAEQKNKLQDFAGRNFLPGIAGLPRTEELQQAAKSFGLAGANNVPNPDFLPTGPLWYPPYPTIAQSYPGIDPLHFFIDLRVSGHIWDRKMNERQLPFKSKHCSAFSVPQTREYNRPLDLTRDETATTSTSSSTTRNHGGKNQRGTHFILTNLTETYKDIREMEKNCNSTMTESRTSSKSSSSDETSNKDYQARILPKSVASPGSSSSSSSREHEETEGKDLRALIGLELVVDYVKEPKEDPNVDEEQSTEVGE